MSLWTPYAEAPLDLSKVKEERRSPVTPDAALMDYYYHPHAHHQYPTREPLPLPPVQPTPYYPGYGYMPYGAGAGVPVPTAQMSPVSAGSTCSGSGFDIPTPTLPSPTYQRPPTLSPPESPPSASSANFLGKHTNYIAEAEVLSDDPDFQAFERDALRAMAERNGGTLLGNNPRMRRAVQTSQAVDDSYRRQRERNNFAAKQSRDRRKLREIHLALKVAYLKNEVGKLKAQLGVTTCIRCRNACE